MSRGGFARTVILWATVPIILAAGVGGWAYSELSGDVDAASSADAARIEAIVEGLAADAEVAAETRTNLARLVRGLDDGVETIELGFYCLVSLLFVTPDERTTLPPERIARFCHLDEATVEFLRVALRP